ncbi:MAG: hypothetical protein K2U26_08085 [Cyclobacteriaceae bacterium]|nr:hypothetical protein [Cyclobacteriaceae bacterium]
MKEKKKKFSNFPPATLHDWETAAKEELGGSDPWKKLSVDVKGLAIKPFYDGKSELRPKALLHPSPQTALGPRTWHNCPRVVVENEKEGNAQALHHLQHGADGVSFELKGAANVEILLKGIEWPYCALIFSVNEDADDLLSRITAFRSKQKCDANACTGAFFANKHEKANGTEAFFTSGFSFPLQDIPAEELINGFKLIADSKSNFLNEPVAIQVEIGQDFFLEIAKLRAIRLVWHRIQQPGKGKNNPSPLFIHAWMRPWSEERYQPHENMLKSTTAAMAAILGGCDALTILPDEKNHVLASRIARNVSNILREESHLSKVADPLAGTYFLEDVTHQLVEKVWAELKQAV